MTTTSWTLCTFCDGRRRAIEQNAASATFAGQCPDCGVVPFQVARSTEDRGICRGCGACVGFLEQPDEARTVLDPLLMGSGTTLIKRRITGLKDWTLDVSGFFEVDATSQGLVRSLGRTSAAVFRKLLYDGTNRYSCAASTVWRRRRHHRTIPRRKPVP